MTRDANDPQSDALDRLAARASLDPFFLGSVLAAYRRRHGLGDALAARLGCAPAVLTRLRLCRRPGAAEPARTAAEDIATIAGRFGLDGAALRRVVEGAASGA